MLDTIQKTLYSCNELYVVNSIIDNKSLFINITLFSLSILSLYYRKSIYTESFCFTDENEVHKLEINRIIINGKLSRQNQTNNNIQHTVESTSNFLHQVAGHTSEYMRKYHFKVLKPMVKPKLFRREIELYEEMEILGNHNTQIAKAFVPKYFGVINIQNGNVVLPYLVLKDLTLKYMKPCTIDIKMGTQTYEPTASIDKKSREHLKYSYQKTIGFRITGFKVYDVTKSIFYSVDKSFGRSLQPMQIKDGFKLFFHNGVYFQRNILVVIIEKLENILIWLTRQVNLHFYCSSLLIVYDGIETQGCFDYYQDNYQRINDTIKSPLSCLNMYDNRINQQSMNCWSKMYYDESKAKTCHYLSKNSDKRVTDKLRQQKSYKFNRKSLNTENIVQVKMIDFAHTLSSTETSLVKSLDKGYIIGITNLINIFRSIVDDIDHNIVYNGVPEHLVSLLHKSMSVSLE